jgi:hypothetical protein
MVLELRALGGFSLLDGHQNSGGTRIGIKPCVVNRNAGVFDPYPDGFRPGLWLQATNETAEACQERLQLYQYFISWLVPESAEGHLELLKVHNIVATLVPETKKNWTVI